MLVCSMSENDHKFLIKDSSGNVIKALVIFGINSQEKAKKGNIVLPYAYTNIEPGDWDAIMAQYAHSRKIQRGVIFAEKSDNKVRERANDEEAQAVDSGTRQLTPDKLSQGNGHVGKATQINASV